MIRILRCARRLGASCFTKVVLPAARWVLQTGLQASDWGSERAGRAAPDTDTAGPSLVADRR